jgi:hypothetical protein
MIRFNKKFFEFFPNHKRNHPSVLKFFTKLVPQNGTHIERKSMSRKLKLVVASWAILLVVILVLGYKLYEEHKWSDIFFSQMMQAERQCDQYRAKEGGVTISNPDYVLPTTQAE